MFVALATCWRVESGGLEFIQYWIPPTEQVAMNNAQMAGKHLRTSTKHRKINTAQARMSNAQTKKLMLRPKRMNQHNNSY